MNDIIEKYLNNSIKNLNTILVNLENNIEFKDNRLWKDSNEFNELINNITKIYFDKYYFYQSNDFKKITKYIRFNNKINRKLKTILLSIIEYFENSNDVDKIVKNENSILYLTVLMYISLIIYEKDFNQINEPKKIEKLINSVIDNFQNIRFKRIRNLNKLIDNIKDVVVINNNFNKYIDDLKSDEISNYFIRINNDSNLYKILFEYNISSLDDYDIKDINIVNNKIDINKHLNKISYDITFFTSFKLLKNGIDKKILFKIDKEYLKDKDLRDYIVNRNSIVNNNIILLVDYYDIENDYDFINLLKDNNIDVYVELNKVFVTNNYNMFMGYKNIIVSEEFLNTNEKYIEIWKDMDMNFIIKDLKLRIDESHLLKRK